MSKIQFITDPEEMKKIIQEELEDFKDQLLNEFKEQLKPKKQEEYLSKADVARLLKIHPNTVETYAEKGYLKKYKIFGKRVLYKRSEVESSLTPLKK